VPKYLIVKQTSDNNNSVTKFEKTNSLFLSQKNYYYNLINTPEGVLPFRPNFGIDYNFVSLDDLVSKIRSKFTGSGFQVEMIEEDTGEGTQKKVIISINSSVIAIISE
jgi:hypothetical protein